MKKYSRAMQWILLCIIWFYSISTAGAEVPSGLASVNALIVMGDSISAGGYATLRQNLSTLLGVNLNYLVLAVPGSVTADLNAQWQQAIPYLKINTGDTLVVFTIGGNDLRWVPLNTAISNIQAILQSYKSKKTNNQFPGNAYFFLADVYNPLDGRESTPECVSNFGNGGIDLDNKIKAWKDGYYSMASNNPQLLTIVDDYTEFKSHGLWSQSSWFRDCIHPNSEGYVALNNLFFRTILTSFGGTPLPTGTNPIGNIDTASCGTINGWAGDKDTPNLPIQIQVYANGEFGLGGLNMGYATANITREKAVCDALGSTQSPCFHGFEFSIPPSLKDGNPHTIYTYGINSPGSGGDNALLLGSPKTISCYLEDLNNDGKIDSSDIPILITDFGKTSNFNQKADLKQDGKINIQDLVILVKKIIS